MLSSLYIHVKMKTGVHGSKVGQTACAQCVGGDDSESEATNQGFNGTS